jgi:hypothetical protein
MDFPERRNSLKGRLTRFPLYSEEPNAGTIS